MRTRFLPTMIIRTVIMFQVNRLLQAALVFLVVAAPACLNADSPGGAVRHEFSSLDGTFVAERVLQGLSQPAALEFLPDGCLLVAQRDRGVITLVDPAGGATVDLAGLPRMVVSGDAGVHDLELHPDFARNGWIYVSYTEGMAVHSTAVVDRFRLEGDEAVDVTRLFTVNAYSEGAYHLAVDRKY